MKSPNPKFVTHECPMVAIPTFPTQYTILTHDWCTFYFHVQKLGDGNSGSASGSVTLTNYFGDNGFSNIYFGTVDQSSNPVPLPTICLTYPTKPPSCPAPGVKGDPHFSGWILFLF